MSTTQIYASSNPIGLEQLREYAPVVFQTAPAQVTSDLYDFVPTIDIVMGMLDEGFKVYGVTTAGTRNIEREGFQKHLLRFRREEDFGANEAPEVIAINSHDGSAAYRVMGGLFRFACANGMVFGDAYKELRVVHKGHDQNVVQDVIDATYEVVSDFERAGEQIDQWRGITLDHDEQMLLAEAAKTARWGDKQMNEGWETKNMLKVNRPEDASDDLYTVFNRLQEATTKLALPNFEVKQDKYGRPRKHMTRTRPVKSIDEGTKLNKALWQITEHFASLKS
jgi:hypothetical protein